VIVQTHIDDGIESLEQITEAIDSCTENIKEQCMNLRDPDNIIDKNRRTDNTMAKEKGQKDKQQSKKQYIEN
jgi:hypothetical protein